MSPSDSVKSALDALLTEAETFVDNSERRRPNRATITANYQSWYTRARRAVAQIIPERVQTFEECYDRKRKDSALLTVTNYAIADYIGGVIDGGQRIDITNRFLVNFNTQLGILRAAQDMTDSALRSLELSILHEIARSNISGARDLLLSGHLRAAGVVCGVVLEKHLQDVCIARQLAPAKKVGIADHNEALKKAGVYDVPLWRLIQRLADIRNLCAHAAGREPTADEVRDLVVGTEKVVAEVS